MSFSVKRNSGDARRLGKLALPIMALVDMVAEQDWERVISLSEHIATEARVNIIEAQMKSPLPATRSKLKS